MLSDIELVNKFREKTHVSLIGQSPIFVSTLAQTARFSQSSFEFPLLFIGETGTGKELFARAAHDNSTRAEKVFLPVNCSAITQDLFESLMFGHEKGSFTGAVKNHEGYVEAAREGTLFLDEIGDMSIENQIRMLRVLDDGGQYSPVGSTEVKRNKSRIVAASNQDLKKKISEGQFREDLFYRLETFLISIPPLRDRKEDIPLLVKFFLEQMGCSFSLTNESWNVLMDYDWPGNIRELQNIVKRVAVQSWNREGEDVKIEPEDLDLRKLNSLTTGIENIVAILAAAIYRDYKVGKQISLNEVSKLIAARVIKLCGDNKVEASIILDKTTKTLRAWAKEG